MQKGILLLMLLISQAFAQQKLGYFDNHTDIGNCKHKGFAYYNVNEQSYTLGGAGTNMWGQADEFHYLWTTIQGDFILRAEVEFFGEGVDPHRKTGWLIKNDLNSETKHVNASIHGDGLTALQYRKMDGGETTEIISSNKAPQVVQLERKGTSYIMSTAVFGEEFTSVELEGMSMDREVYVGLYVCSHNPDIVESVKFRNVRIIKPVDPDYQPYRDYIGSKLEIMDVQSGHRKILYSSAHSIQAPNWTVDGQHLVYNTKGRLYQYDLATTDISPVFTGFANRNNNDHVFSFDGKLLGISHHNDADEGRSSLYYLKVGENSEPVPVTRKGVGASYLHGWSIDNKKMVFTAHRKNQYDIYSVEVNSGKETQLTNYKTLDDGPEYSPDGQYIFFNSMRTGKMKLWRMDADGKNQKQFTFDEYNDWFPHISPDSKWIVFISFPKDIDPSSHPFYKHCLIRIMPYEGGEARVIGYIYGGQGSINVPSWSPDSRFISFVSNSDF